MQRGVHATLPQKKQCGDHLLYGQVQVWRYAKEQDKDCADKRIATKDTLPQYRSA